MLKLLGIQAEQFSYVWKAPCPMHRELEPSWSIIDCPGDPKHGAHWCFGCERGGGPVDLVMRLHDFVLWSSAYEWIRENELDSELSNALEVQMVVKQRPGAFRIPTLVKGIGQFESWPTPAKRYALLRGMTAEQVARWGIGYAVDGRLRGRIVFPIRDERGVPQSYSARAFITSTRTLSLKEPARYLTPDDDENWVSAAIFGSEHWPVKSERELIVILEGALNALACELMGAKSIGALGGAHVEPTQMLRLATFPRALVLTDSDAAGERVAEELRAGLWRTTAIERATLPAGCDPASMIVKPAQKRELARILKSHGV